MTDGTIEAIYYSVGILFVCTLSSYANKKAGIIISSLISFMSIAFAFMIAAAGGDFLIYGLVFFPGLTWICFWLGRFFKKCQSSR